LNARRHRRRYPNTACQAPIRFKPIWDRYEGSDVIEAGVDTEELETSGPMGGNELGQEQSPEQARENLHGQDEVRPAWDPARAINGDAAARHDHVNMGMVAPTPTTP